ncbi:unnamed protein product [Staurois parvus]|uniref:Uncharacterized protein n=1 Tax=Staurois parvus TaxID=386267 RepID=A0ABN9B429_9NEOB|nr:unnamed protein product [Staurois parvus]
MGPCTASSCCCQAPNLPWAPIPPPHAAAKSRVCHGSLYGLPLLLSPSPHSAMCHFRSLHTLLCVNFFDIRVLADYGPPIAAARPLICHGPLYRLLMLLPQSLSWVHIVSHRHTMPCATFRSPHTAGVFNFLT